MFLRRTATALTRASASRPMIATATVRGFAVSTQRKEEKGKMVPFDQVKTESDLLPPGVDSGEVPTDYLQATGLERLEILGKMQGVDIFDMKPLDASRKGTMQDPIPVRSFGDEQYAGCTGSPADSHVVKWLTMSRGRPIERCPECGSVYKMEYVGPADDPHHHDDHHGHGYEEPKTFADFVKPEYH